MDYKAIYYKIIENAKKETENGNRLLGYFEKHHIQPKSLGGTNSKENLVRLTAREHFICHWLLVKMYDKGTVERNKMLCALWRMQGQTTKEKHRYINSRAYEALRIEFANMISSRTSINQSGEKNSQFGTSWYTNRNTGESKKFREKPIEDFWIKGRNLFNGNELWSLINRRKIIESKKITNTIYYSELKEQGLIAKNGRINPNGLSNQDIENRVNEILNSGIDLTKYGWVNKVSKLTGLNRTTINKLVLSHPELKEKVYYRK
jgi:hypothetical protein